MTHEYTLRLSSELKTILFGSMIATICDKGCVIFLYGDVGTGKTVFCKGFLQKLGYIGHVHSPTYTLVESYFFDNWNVYHFDCYRLSSIREIENFGFREYFDGQSVYLVEWPKLVMKTILTEDIAIIICYCGAFKQHRKIIIRAVSDRGVRMLHVLLNGNYLDEIQI